MNVMSARTRAMKYLLVMAISVAMVFATISPALAATDVSGHWAQTILEKWVRDGLILGYPDGTMKPDEAVSRAEFVVFLNRASKAVNPNATSSFSDVQRGDWFYADVASAAAAGYVVGYEDGTFRPSAPITREESAVILGRALGLTAGDTSTLSSFKDSSAIASWAKGAVAALCAKGIMKGYEDGTFGPSRAISRAETVVILDRGIVEPTLVVVVPVIPSTGGGGGGHAAPSITVSTVTATNGTVTVTLDRAPGTAPVIGDFAVTQAIGGGTATAVTPSAISTAAAVVTLTVPTVAAGEAQQSVVISVRHKGGTAVPATAFTVAALPAPTATVTLGNTASGIGKVATVTLSGYTGAGQYRLLKTDGTPLSGLVDVGSTVVVMFLNPGDSCKVEVYNATGDILETKTVTATASSTGQTGNATVTLGSTSSGIGKVATVTLSGYTGAAQYRLLKTDGTPLSGLVDVGSTVVVMFLNPGDSCKVEVYNATGDILETKTVTTTGASAPATSATVTLANTASGIGKVATVTLSGYTSATQYRLLKADGTALTNNVNVGSTVVVMFLNPGDTCKVEVYSAGGLIDTKTVTAQ